MFPWIWIGSISRLYLCIISYPWLQRTSAAHTPLRLRVCCHACSFAAVLRCPRVFAKMPSVLLQLVLGLVHKMANSNNSCNLAHKITSLSFYSCMPHTLSFSLQYIRNHQANSIFRESAALFYRDLYLENSVYITPSYFIPPVICGKSEIKVVL